MIAASRQLLQRRVPQFVAVYLGVAWAVTEFVNMVEQRYGLSPHLTDIALLGFALLLPSVVLFTYHHGKPGADEFVRSEKIAIPLNVIAAAAILFLLFGQQDLGAVMTPVTIQDEEGNTIERVVPKASYRKRMALFNFDGAAEDTAVAWLRYSLPFGVATDLGQDIFLDVRPSPYFREKLRQLGYPDEVGIPLSLKRKIAEEAHLPYFTAASVTRAGGEIVVELALYETTRGEVLKLRRFSNSDVFALIDQISAALKEDLGLPRLETVKDLPVAEVLTASLPAFRAYSNAAVALALHDDWPRAATLAEQAVEHDPKFATAHVLLHGVYLLSNQTDKSLPPLQQAMDHLYRMPERLQYDVRAEYHYMKQDLEKAYAAAKMKVDLYPEDISGYALLANFQAMRNDKDGRIASTQKILELDPGQQEMLRVIGELYEEKFDLENALRYYSQYAERFPARQEASVSLARVYHVRGQHEQAVRHYEKALIITPGDVASLIGLATVQRDVGEFEAAEGQLEEALASAKTAQHRTSALDAWGDYYKFRGQMRQGMAHAEQSVQEMAKFQPPLITASTQARMVGDYVRAGQPDVARRTLDRVAAQLQAPFNTFAALGEMEMQLALERPDEAEQAATTAEQRIQQHGFAFLTPAVVLGRGRVAELRDNCEQAVQHFQEKHLLDPKDYMVHSHAGRCYRRLGDARKAIEYAQRTLDVIPFHARTNYEIALAYLDAGDRTKAVEHLRRAAQTWKDADATYKLAGEAKAKLKQLESAS